MAATAVMSGATLVNGYAQGEAQKAQGRYAERMSELNARMIDLRADDTLKRGDQEAGVFGKKIRKLVGAQRAALGASGIAIDSGSAQAVQDETELSGKLDALTIKNNAWKEAWGLRTEARNARFEGKMARTTADGNAARTYAAAGLDAFKIAASELRPARGPAPDKKKETV